MERPRNWGRLKTKQNISTKSKVYPNTMFKKKLEIFMTRDSW